MNEYETAPFGSPSNHEKRMMCSSEEAVSSFSSSYPARMSGSPGMTVTSTASRPSTLWSDRGEKLLGMGQEDHPSNIEREQRVEYVQLSHPTMTTCRTANSSVFHPFDVLYQHLLNRKDDEDEETMATSTFPDPKNMTTAEAAGGMESVRSFLSSTTFPPSYASCRSINSRSMPQVVKPETNGFFQAPASHREEKALPLEHVSSSLYSHDAHSPSPLPMDGATPSLHGGSSDDCMTRLANRMDNDTISGVSHPYARSANESSITSIKNAGEGGLLKVAQQKDPHPPHGDAEPSQGCQSSSFLSSPVVTTTCSSPPRSTVITGVHSIHTKVWRNQVEPMKEEEAPKEIERREPPIMHAVDGPLRDPHHHLLQHRKGEKKDEEVQLPYSRMERGVQDGGNETCVLPSSSRVPPRPPFLLAPSPFPFASSPSCIGAVEGTIRNGEIGCVRWTAPADKLLYSPHPARAAGSPEEGGRERVWPHTVRRPSESRSPASVATLLKPGPSSSSGTCSPVLPEGLRHTHTTKVTATLPRASSSLSQPLLSPSHVEEDKNRSVCTPSQETLLHFSYSSTAQQDGVPPRPPRHIFISSPLKRSCSGLPKIFLKHEGMKNGEEENAQVGARNSTTTTTPTASSCSVGSATSGASTDSTASSFAEEEGQSSSSLGGRHATTCNATAMRPSGPLPLCALHVVPSCTLLLRQRQRIHDLLASQREQRIAYQKLQELFEGLVCTYQGLIQSINQDTEAERIAARNMKEDAEEMMNQETGEAGIEKKEQSHQKGDEVSFSLCLSQKDAQITRLRAALQEAREEGGRRLEMEREEWNREYKELLQAHYQELACLIKDLTQIHQNHSGQNLKQQQLHQEDNKEEGEPQGTEENGKAGDNRDRVEKLCGRATTESIARHEEVIFSTPGVSSLALPASPRWPVEPPRVKDTKEDQRAREGTSAQKESIGETPSEMWHTVSFSGPSPVHHPLSEPSVDPTSPYFSASKRSAKGLGVPPAISASASFSPPGHFLHGGAVNAQVEKHEAVLQLLTDELQDLWKEHLVVLQDRTGLRRQIKRMERELEERTLEFQQRTLPHALQEVESRTKEMEKEWEKRQLHQEETFHRARAVLEREKQQWQEQAEKTTAASEQLAFRLRVAQETLQAKEDLMKEMRHEILACHKREHRQEGVCYKEEVEAFEEKRSQLQQWQDKLLRVEREREEGEKAAQEQLQQYQRLARQRQSEQTLAIEEMTRRFHQAEDGWHHAQQQVRVYAERVQALEEVTQRGEVQYRRIRREKEEVEEQHHTLEEKHHRLVEERQALDRDRETLLRHVKRLQSRCARQEKAIEEYRNALWELQSQKHRRRLANVSLFPALESFSSSCEWMKRNLTSDSLSSSSEDNEEELPFRFHLPYRRNLSPFSSAASHSPDAVQHTDQADHTQGRRRQKEGEEEMETNGKSKRCFRVASGEERSERIKKEHKKSEGKEWEKGKQKQKREWSTHRCRENGYHSIIEDGVWDHPSEAALQSTAAEVHPPLTPSGSLGLTGMDKRPVDAKEHETSFRTSIFDTTFTSTHPVPNLPGGVSSSCAWAGEPTTTIVPEAGPGAAEGNATATRGRRAASVRHGVPVHHRRDSPSGLVRSLSSSSCCSSSCKSSPVHSRCATEATSPSPVHPCSHSIFTTNLKPFPPGDRTTLPTDHHPALPPSLPSRVRLPWTRSSGEDKGRSDWRRSLHPYAVEHEVVHPSRSPKEAEKTTFTKERQRMCLTSGVMRRPHAEGKEMHGGEGREKKIPTVSRERRKEGNHFDHRVDCPLPRTFQHLLCSSFPGVSHEHTTDRFFSSVPWPLATSLEKQTTQASEEDLVSVQSGHPAMGWKMPTTWAGGVATTRAAGTCIHVYNAQCEKEAAPPSSLMTGREDLLFSRDVQKDAKKEKTEKDPHGEKDEKEGMRHRCSNTPVDSGMKTEKASDTLEKEDSSKEGGGGETCEPPIPFTHTTTTPDLEPPSFHADARTVNCSLSRPNGVLWTFEQGEPCNEGVRHTEVGAPASSFSPFIDQSSVPMKDTEDRTGKKRADGDRHGKEGEEAQGSGLVFRFWKDPQQEEAEWKSHSFPRVPYPEMVSCNGIEEEQERRERRVNKKAKVEEGMNEMQYPFSSGYSSSFHLGSPIREYKRCIEESRSDSGRSKRHAPPQGKEVKPTSIVALGDRGGTPVLSAVCDTVAPVAHGTHRSSTVPSVASSSSASRITEATTAAAEAALAIASQAASVLSMSKHHSFSQSQSLLKSLDVVLTRYPQHSSDREHHSSPNVSEDSPPVMYSSASGRIASETLRTTTPISVLEMEEESEQSDAIKETEENRGDGSSLRPHVRGEIRDNEAVHTDEECVREWKGENTAWTFPVSSSPASGEGIEDAPLKDSLWKKEGKESERKSSTSSRLAALEAAFSAPFQIPMRTE